MAIDPAHLSHLRHETELAAAYIGLGLGQLTDDTKREIERAVMKDFLDHAKALPAVLEALSECENALLGYVDEKEKRGDIVGYGRKVLRQTRAALAAALGDGTGWRP